MTLLFAMKLLIFETTARLPHTIECALTARRRPKRLDIECREIAVRRRQLYCSVPHILGGIIVPAGKSCRQPWKEPTPLGPGLNVRFPWTTATSVPQPMSCPAIGHMTVPPVTVPEIVFPFVYSTSKLPLINWTVAPNPAFPV